MKKNFYIKLICISILFIMLVSYETTRSSTLYGLELWLYNVVPVLFPYIFIINIIMLFDAFTILSFILYPILNPILKISKNACLCMVAGFFCGFPVGIKTINDMVKSNKISISEGNYLACFCNNLSPSFYLNFIINDNIHRNNKFISFNHKLILNIILILLPYISAIICSFIYRFSNKYVESDINNLCKLSDEINNTKTDTISNFINTCITGTFEALFKVGGYIILFSIITGILLNYTPLPDIVKSIVTSILEISNGATAFSNVKLKYIITILIPLCSFGGLSAMFQSLQMIDVKGISRKNYIKYKFINLSITFVLATIVCLLFGI